MEIISGFNTDRGLYKENNQDSLLIKVAKTSIGTVSLAVLCDGMGGLNNGEIASAIAVQVYEEWFDYSLASYLNPFSYESIMKQMEEQMRIANQKILEYGKSHNIRMGTTCSTLLLLHHYFYILVHIGDTRIYEISSEVRLLTKDHTLVEREVVLGNITPLEARTDKRRNILLQCLGDNEMIHPQVETGQVRENSVYLLCSDGLYQQCSSMDFGKLSAGNINTEEELTLQLKQLIRRCRERKEKDDITAVGLRIMT